MFKKVLFTIILWPLNMVAETLSLLLALIFVIVKPIYAAFGFKETYNDALKGIVDGWDEIKDDLKFD